VGEVDTTGGLAWMRGATTEDSEEVILEVLDGLYSHVVSVFLGGNKFIGHAGGLVGGLVTTCTLRMLDC
jgi:hypothetical protein